jgi:hypothetical protein
MLGGKTAAPKPSSVPAYKGLTTNPHRPGGAVTKSDAKEVTNRQQQQQPAQQQTPRQQRIEAIRKDSKFYESSPEQKILAAEMRRLLAAESTEGELQALIDSTIQEKRARYGVQPDVIGSIAEKWDSNVEGNYLVHVAALGTEPEFVKASMDLYSRYFNGSLGQVEHLDAVQMEADFRALAKEHGISRSLVDKLVNAEKARLNL